MKTILLLILLFVSYSFPQDYYPLSVDNEWKYKFMNNKEDSKKVIVKEYMKDLEAFMVTIIFKMGDITPIVSDEVIEKRNNYIIQIGQRGGLFGSSEWNLDTRTLLILPFEIGKKWESGSHQLKVIKKVSVNVNGQDYRDCYVIKHINQDKFVTLEYYAPNIGLVKTTSEDGKVTILELIEAIIK